MVGSYFFSLSIVPIFIYFNFLAGDINLLLIIFIILISSVSQVGDIVVSIFKRKSFSLKSGHNFFEKKISVYEICHSKKLLNLFLFPVLISISGSGIFLVYRF